MNQRILLILLFFCFSALNPVEAQPENPNLSPYHAVYNHLYYLQTDSYDQEKAARSFNLPLTEGRRKAVKLKQILDGKGLYVNLDALPTQSDYIDSIKKTAVYTIDARFPEIYLSIQGGMWYYSPETVEAIPRLHQITFPFGSQWNTYFHAPFWQNEYIGLALFQWTELGLLVLLCAIVFWLSNRLIRFTLRVVLHRSSMSGGDLPINRLSRVSALFLAVKLLKWLIPVVMLSPRLNKVVMVGLDVLGLFFLILIALQILEVLYSFLRKKAEQTESKMDDQLIPVLRRVSQILVWTVGSIFILRDLNINVTALLAGISIGGLAIALAAQDTVKNFFGSILIFIDKPFQIGDWIRFQEVDGMVEEVGLRATRIRTFANSVTYVPNGLLANQVVDNMGLRRYRRYSTELALTYDTKPELIDLFIQGIRDIIQMHPLSRKDVYEVHLNSFGSSSLNVMLYMFFEVPTWTEELKARHDVNQAILILSRDLGIRFAFPTQTLHIEEFPGTMATTPIPKSAAVAGENLSRSLQFIAEKWNSDSSKG